MAIIRPKLLTPITVLHELDGPNAVEFAAATSYVSGLIDRSAQPTFAELVRVGFRRGAGAAPVGAVGVWVYYDYGSGTAFVNTSKYPDTVSGATSGSIDPAADNLIHAGDIEFDGSEGYWRRFLSFNVAKLFGGVVPPRWALVVHNNTGAPIVGNGFTGGDGSKYWAAIQGYQAESL